MIPNEKIILTCQNCFTVPLFGRKRRFCSTNCQAQAARKRYKNNGLCTRCQKPSSNRLCKLCRLRHNTKERDRYIKLWMIRFVSKLCGQCGKIPRLPKTRNHSQSFYCINCLWKQRIRNRKRRKVTLLND